jgi:hypothetical protein
MTGKILSKSDDTVLGEVLISGWLEDKGVTPTPAVTLPSSKQVNSSKSDDRIPVM